MGTNSNRILIVEDDPIIAHDLSLLLQKKGFQIVAVAHRADKAIDLLSKQNVDLAILDIHLGSGETGIDVARFIKTKFKIPYIFLTSFSDAETLQAAQEQGPYGYLVKPFQEQTLYTTIAIALSNFERQNEKLNLEKLEKSLTDQEKSICRLMFEGKSYQEIADGLSVSINTIRYHVKNLYVKLQVNSRAELVASLMN